MVIQIQITGNLEKQITKLIDDKYKHLTKKGLVVEMVRKQVAIEMDITEVQK